VLRDDEARHFPRFTVNACALRRICDIR